MTSSLTNAEKRAEWLNCYSWVIQASHQFLMLDVQAEALRRYPDPKETTIATMETGHQYRIHDGHVDFRPSPNDDWYHGGGFTISDCLSLGEIAQAAQQEMEQK